MKGVIYGIGIVMILSLAIAAGPVLILLAVAGGVAMGSLGRKGRRR